MCSTRTPHAVLCLPPPGQCDCTHVHAYIADFDYLSPHRPSPTLIDKRRLVAQERGDVDVVDRVFRLHNHRQSCRITCTSTCSLSEAIATPTCSMRISNFKSAIHKRAIYSLYSFSRSSLPSFHRVPAWRMCHTWPPCTSRKTGVRPPTNICS